MTDASAVAREVEKLRDALRSSQQHVGSLLGQAADTFCPQVSCLVAALSCLTNCCFVTAQKMAQQLVTGVILTAWVFCILIRSTCVRGARVVQSHPNVAVHQCARSLLNPMHRRHVLNLPVRCWTLFWETSLQGKFLSSRCVFVCLCV